MPQTIELRPLQTDDMHYILSSIYETLSVFDYPTPASFSAITRCALVNFLKGTQYPTNTLEEGSVTLFRQLNEFSYSHNEYMWFIDWSRKLSGMVKERKLRE